MASQRFCLRWNNHQSNMLSVFDQLLHAETFTDVTLAVEGQLLKAHKMVLSACSPYFQALFVNHQEKHPIVILKDVPYADMKSLLDFMYRGEVSVDQERLTAFLRVAESLRIKGLTEVNEDKCDIPALTGSLLQQAQAQQTQQQPAHTPPPSLHRIQQYVPGKRPAPGGAPSNLLMPLLGNALLQPKRKRGRPRKLSGSSSEALVAAATPPVLGADASTTPTRVGDRLVHGSPEMLEVKMGAESFADESGEEGGEALLIDEDTDVAPHTPSKDSESAEYGYVAYEENPDVPIITLEVISQRDHSDEEPPDEDRVTPKSEPEDEERTDSEAAELSRTRRDLLEYVTRSDGSVVCRLCGEVLASRTHWYRHKYKLHVAPALQPAPAPLFQCRQCKVYFKSRKGYIGHLASRHGESDTSPVRSPPEVLITPLRQTDTELEPRQAPTQSRSKERKSRSSGSTEEGGAAWSARRKREEQLVADIIDRVRRECEAAGAGGSTRRGYTRRTTVMNT